MLPVQVIRELTILGRHNSQGVWKVELMYHCLGTLPHGAVLIGLTYLGCGYAVVPCRSLPDPGDGLLCGVWGVHSWRGNGECNDNDFTQESIK